MYLVNRRRLTADGVDSPAANRKVAITNLDMASGIKTYSEAIDVEKNVGFFALLVTENKAGGAGDVDIYLEYSWDGTNWYRPNTTASAALTQEANVVDALANTTKWIIMTARLAKYVRVVFDPDADSAVTADFAFQEAT